MAVGFLLDCCVAIRQLLAAFPPRCRRTLDNFSRLAWGSGQRRGNRNVLFVVLCLFTLQTGHPAKQGRTKVASAGGTR